MPILTTYQADADGIIDIQPLSAINTIAISFFGSEYILLLEDPRSGVAIVLLL